MINIVYQHKSISNIMSYAGSLIDQFTKFSGIDSKTSLFYASLVILVAKLVDSSLKWSHL